MGNCCSTQPAPLSDEEKALRRNKMAEAAEARAGSFKQGGGGEALKAKSKRLEEAQKKNFDAGVGIGGLNDPKAWD
jgi:hypothetical protein